MTECPHCEADVADGLETCEKCGKEVASPASSASPASPVSAASGVKVTMPEVTSVPLTTDSLATERLTRAELAAAERNQAKPAARVASTRKPTLRRRVGRRPYSYLATIGVAGLVVGGLVGFGATYLSGAGLHAAGSTEAIKLPAKLSGGFARSKTADPQLQTSISSARKTLGAGTDMALYTKGQTDVLVQATRLPGQAILQAGLKYAHVGKAVCASGTAASSPEAVCTRTDGGLTVQVSATDSKTAAKYVEEVYAKLA